VTDKTDGPDCWRALGATWSCYAPVQAARTKREWATNQGHFDWEEEP
jgi:hypothetical protein